MTAHTEHDATDVDQRVILQRFPIGFQWPTMDPFLFCVHHNDQYPAGNDDFGPAASLDGRQAGQDFEGIDGWRMYHGDRVPGFPNHPHRGFETVTFVRQGLIDHADSLGAAARFGRGDVQWLTAGSGIVHSETFPLLQNDRPNPAELFQIWVNLPRADKMAEPHFSMLWDEDIPHIAHIDDEGRTVQITVIAGSLEGHTPPASPPHSWASRADSDMAIWHVVLQAGTTWTMPQAAGEGTLRTAYVFHGVAASFDGELVESGTGVVVDASVDVRISSDHGAEILVLQGRPIAEPVAQYGPFVLNDKAGIEQAFDDYRRTGFGGWPWPSAEPVHGDLSIDRFARRPDGTIEHPPAR